jgi:hypothetical protein
MRGANLKIDFEFSTVNFKIDVLICQAVELVSKDLQDFKKP